MGYCVYILYSEKLDRFYTGFSSDFDIRLSYHRMPDSRKYTYRSDDWVLFLKINCESKQQAVGIESHIKRMKSKKYIENLKRYIEMREKLLEKYS